MACPCTTPAELEDPSYVYNIYLVQHSVPKPEHAVDDLFKSLEHFTFTYKTDSEAQSLSYVQLLNTKEPSSSSSHYVLPSFGPPNSVSDSTLAGTLLPRPRLPPMRKIQLPDTPRTAYVDSGIRQAIKARVAESALHDMIDWLKDRGETNYEYYASSSGDHDLVIYPKTFTVTNGSFEPSFQPSYDVFHQLVHEGVTDIEYFSGVVFLGELYTALVPVSTNAFLQM